MTDATISEFLSDIRDRAKVIADRPVPRPEDVQDLATMIMGLSLALLDAFNQADLDRMIALGE
jgi:hypothetical protein